MHVVDEVMIEDMLVVAAVDVVPTALLGLAVAVVDVVPAVLLGCEAVHAAPRQALAAVAFEATAPAHAEAAVEADRARVVVEAVDRVLEVVRLAVAGQAHAAVLPVAVDRAPVIDLPEVSVQARAAAEVAVAVRSDEVGSVASVARVVSAQREAALVVAVVSVAVAAASDVAPAVVAVPVAAASDEVDLQDALGLAPSLVSEILADATARLLNDDSSFSLVDRPDQAASPATRRKARNRLRSRSQRGRPQSRKRRSLSPKRKKTSSASTSDYFANPNV